MNVPILIPSTFVHAISADDWMGCWNMHLRGTLTSFDLMTADDPVSGSVRTLPIDALRHGYIGENSMAMSHRLQSVLLGARIRRGERVGWGVPPYETTWATPEQTRQILSVAERELRYEEMRRIVAPDAPSRLGGLWLAHDSAGGRTMVSKMKGQDLVILRVRIRLTHRLLRADAHWWEGGATDEMIRGYWSGRTRPGFEAPAWEFLLEGMIECVDDEELSRLKAHALRQAQQLGAESRAVQQDQVPTPH